MPTLEDRVAAIEAWMKTSKPQLARVASVSNALEGRPSDATLTLPHNDSWIFEDNVDGTHPANLRYLIATNITRVVSARLSIFLAPYRTYNSLSFAATGAGSAHHHGYTASVTTGNVANTHTLRFENANGWSLDDGASRIVQTTNFDTNNTVDESSHTHPVPGTSVLGVTEGATPAGITISFDGVDKTVALGGPFSTDQLELNVRPYLALTLGVKHTIAMQPTGLGRIEAHLRLGVYVSAGQLI